MLEPDNWVGWEGDAAHQVLIIKYLIYTTAILNELFKIVHYTIEVSDLLFACKKTGKRLTDFLSDISRSWTHTSTFIQQKDVVSRQGRQGPCSNGRDIHSLSKLVLPRFLNDLHLDFLQPIMS